MTYFINPKLLYKNSKETAVNKNN